MKGTRPFFALALGTALLLSGRAALAEEALLVPTKGNTLFESANSTAKRFDSREQSDQNNWPALILTYDATAVAPSTWGALKENAR